MSLANCFLAGYLNFQSNDGFFPLATFCMLNNLDILTESPMMVGLLNEVLHDKILVSCDFYSIMKTLVLLPVPCLQLMVIVSYFVVLLLLLAFRAVIVLLVVVVFKSAYINFSVVLLSAFL